MDDPLLDILFQRGLAHEKAYVDSLQADGQSIVNLADVKDRDAAVARTRDAMRSGADVIVQAALRDGRWYGRPDVMRRIEKPSSLDTWSYEIADTKLARETRAKAVDVLFVDEAGQMSLANVLAVSHAAKNVVLLGDPQQLEQPQKGSHPEGVNASALQHILGEHQTLPSDRGIFLPVTWRLAPSICSFTSELFYETRLASRPGLERQLTGVGDFDGSGLWVVEVGHDGNRNSSIEEIEVVADLVARLTALGARWTDEHGKDEQMTS
ncbi:MAG: hypothetical protein ACREV1_09850, partial [Gammaproteobacteria bacterium]